MSAPKDLAECHSRGNKEVPSPSWNDPMLVGSDLSLLALRSEEYTVPLPPFAGRIVLPDEHVVPAWHLGTCGIPDPPSHQKFKLLLNGGLDRKEQQAALSEALVTPTSCEPLEQRGAEGNSNPQQTPTVG